jgi:integrase
MRRVELCALEWGNVDLPVGVILIVQVTTDVRGKNEVSKTKNRISMRKITVDPDTAALLKRWRAEQLSQRIKWFEPWEGDFVFTTRSGSPISLSDASRYAAVVFKDAQIEGVSLHNLRHTCVTRLLAAGVPASDVAAYVGHASTQMTLVVYGLAAENYAGTCADIMQSTLKIGTWLAHTVKK